MPIVLEPIGYVSTKATSVPRHWTVSDVEGELVIDEKYQEGLKDIKDGQRIVVIFHFDRSPKFDPQYLQQIPPHPHRKRKLGVFSICSPIRPNPIGLSVVEVLSVKGNRLRVRGIDMFDKTPILDIKPDIRDKADCPSHEDCPY